MGSIAPSATTKSQAVFGSCWPANALGAASPDVPVPLQWPGPLADANAQSPQVKASAEKELATGEGDAVDDELLLPARRLRGLHSRASPRASKACEGCRR